MQKSYIVILTKSCYAASLIHTGLNAARASEGYTTTGFGAVNEDSRVPVMYHNAGYFYAIAEYDNGDGNRPKYELIIC